MNKSHARQYLTSKWIVVLTVLFGIAVPGCTQESEGDAGCTGATPEAILLPDTYKDQQFKRGDENQATESALIDSGTRMEIGYSGCFDGIEQKFTFTVKSQPGKENDIRHWANFSRTKIASLKVDQQKAWFLSSIIEFLSRAPDYESKDNKISVCRDGSVPDIDGCGFESGGGYSFELQRDGSKLHVIAAQYYTL